MNIVKNHTFLYQDSSDENRIEPDSSHPACGRSRPGLRRPCLSFETYSHLVNIHLPLHKQLPIVSLAQPPWGSASTQLSGASQVHTFSYL